MMKSPPSAHSPPLMNSPGRRDKIIEGGAAMPVHDWSRVDANVFHHFHQQWTATICNALNAGLLPAGYSALVEQHAAGLVPDVLALQRRRRTRPNGGTLATATPQVKHVIQTKALALAARGNRIA